MLLGAVTRLEVFLFITFFPCTSNYYSLIRPSYNTLRRPSEPQYAGEL